MIVAWTLKDTELADFRCCSHPQRLSAPISVYLLQSAYFCVKTIKRIALQNMLRAINLNNAHPSII